MAGRPTKHDIDEWIRKSGSKAAHDPGYEKAIADAIAQADAELAEGKGLTLRELRDKLGLE